MSIKVSYLIYKRMTVYTYTHTHTHIHTHIYIYIYIYIRLKIKPNRVRIRFFRAVNFLFFPRRDLNPHHCYTAAPFA